MRNTFLYLIHIFAISLSLNLQVMAEEQLPTQDQSNAQSLVAPPDWSKNWPEIHTQKTERFSVLWNEILLALDTKDWSLANQKFNELLQIREELGITEVADYSSALLTYAEVELKSGNKESAAFLVRKALELSPLSFNTLRQANKIKLSNSEISKSLGVGSLFKLFLGRSDHLFNTLNALVYPILWAFTIALSLAFIIFLASNVTVLLSSLAMILPSSLRGILSCLMLLVFLLLPPYLGPLWMLAFWSLITLAFLPRKSWLVGLTAIIFVAWGALAPIRENLSTWLSNEGTQRVLRVSSGVFSKDDLKQIRSSGVDNKGDIASQFVIGQLLKRQGAYKEAEDIFAMLRNTMASSSRADIQLAAVYYLQGNSIKAKSILESLGKTGESSPEFNFNLSKLLFEETDTEASRAKFELALIANPNMVSQLQKKEELVGMQHPISMAESSLSFLDLMRTGLSPQTETLMMANKRLERLMPGGNTMTAMLLGGGLFLLFLVRLFKPGKEWRRIYFSNYQQSPLFYSVIRLIPGGAWILNGAVITAVFIIFLVVILVIPIIEWPRDALACLDVLGDLRLYYIYTVAFVVAALCYIGFHSYEGKSK